MIGEEYPAVAAAQKKYRPVARARRRCCSSAVSGLITTRNCSAKSAWRRSPPATSSPIATITKAAACCPTIKVDADSRNIEELHVDADPEQVTGPRTQKCAEAAGCRPGYDFKDYDGMMAGDEGQERW